MDGVLDGRIAGRRAEHVRAHLEACPACRAEFEARQALLRALRGLPPEPLPAGFAERLRRRLAAALPAPQPPRWWWSALPAAGVAAGFLAAAFLAGPLLAVPPTPSAMWRAVTTAGPRAAASTAKEPATSGPVPIGHAGPLPDQRSGAGVANAAAVPSLAPDSTAGGGAAPAAGAPGSGSPSVLPAAVAPPEAISLTILAPSPLRAVEDLSTLAAAVGGRVVTTYAGPATGAPAGAPQPVATLDAVLPAAAAGQYAGEAAREGTLLAQAGAAPSVRGAAEAATPVRVLVTVLATPPGSPAGAVPEARAPASPSAARQASSAWRVRVLLGAARLAPWAGGGALGLFAVWGVVRLLRARLVR
jgi:hypothetical protein